MQSDFDKILRKNLKGYEADFNPADWQKMESMLPKQSRKPYALIALLLLSVGIFGLLVGTREFSKENYSAVIESEKNSLEESSVAGLQTNLESDKADKNNAGKVRDIQKQNTEQTKSKQEIHESGISKSEDNVWTPSPTGEGRGEVVMKKTESREKSVIDIESKNSEAANLQDNSDRKRSANPKTNPYQSTLVANSEAAESFHSDAHSNSHQADFALASIEAGVIKLDDEKNLAERNALSDDTAPKHKPQRKIVTFVLGGGAGMNFSFIDATRWTNPGYTVDVAQEIMFINRIGIAFTQGYSERKYDGGQYPCPSGTLNCPTSYNSTVRSVDFGVDLKANLIHKTKWNWYVKTGIINTVKLKEEFNYSYPQTDTITSPTLPLQTNFNGGSFSEAMQDNLSGLDKADYPSDLTVSGIKRYHIAFHSATGFDVALNSKLQLQFEAGHSFTQPTVGVDDKRLHSIGVNGRLFYRFGR